MKNVYLKQTLQWVAALLLGAFIVSMLSFCYYRPVGWMERDKNATSAVWEPNSVIVNMLEGAGITHVDSRGYTNLGNQELDDDLILCIGASYVQSKEVMEDKKYTALLNEKLKDDDKLKVYNLSRDAYMYPEIVAGFSAAIQEFPQTKVAILDISNTDFSLEELTGALQEREYDEEQTGEGLYKKISTKEKLKLKLKDYFPIISILKYQISQTNGTAVDGASVVKKENTIAEKEYEEALNATMELMRKSFNGRIIVLYHPATILEKDGSMSIKQPKFKENFEKMCEKNKIEFVDMEADFLEAYEDNYIVPYGFQNTTIGEGHINESGQNIIAERLYSVITKEK